MFSFYFHHPKSRTDKPIEMLNDINPFRISKNELNCTSNRIGEGKSKIKPSESKKKIWQRSNEHAAERTKLIKEILQNAAKDMKEDIQHGTVDQRTPETKSLDEVIDGLQNYLASQSDRNDEKESLCDFIAKKRQIFLLQLSINIKQEEIKKLSEKLKEKEEILKNSEKLLEQDTLKFDAFLKENEEKTQESMRLADIETNIRIEKEQHLRTLKQELESLQSSINEHNIAIEECMRLKAFIDELTPEEWIVAQTEEKRKRQRERRRKRIEIRQESWKKEQEEKIAKENERIREMESMKRRRRRIEKSNNLSDTQDGTNQNQAESSPLPTFEDEELTSSDEEIPMYFTKSQDLLDIFKNLEEENLFLIQNIQEAEQSLDEMTERFEQSKSEIQIKANDSFQTISDITKSITAKKDLVETLQTRVERKALCNSSKEQTLMTELEKKVKQAYRACGFTYAGAAPRTLHMLAEIETKMEGIIARLQTVPNTEFQRENKLKERKRRDAKRAHLQAEQAKLQEERNRKALERSMLPPKKVGKKIMYRSYLVQKQQDNVKRKGDALTKEELEELKYLT